MKNDKKWKEVSYDLPVLVKKDIVLEKIFNIFRIYFYVEPLLKPQYWPKGNKEPIKRPINNRLFISEMKKSLSHKDALYQVNLNLAHWL